MQVLAGLCVLSIHISNSLISSGMWQLMNELKGYNAGYDFDFPDDEQDVLPLDPS